ncbi:MAG TPA: L,D-transpeptidase [Ktedonobacterales bacterium]|nr:L,D-transpeptidase [Ktedonobacterales bacterium]
MREHEQAGRPEARRRARLFRYAAFGVTLLVAVSMALAGCAADTHSSAAKASKAKLDTELHHARTDLGIPDWLLAPIEQQEKSIASGQGGLSSQNAEKNYDLLYSQLTGIEQTAGQTLKTQAGKDVDAFTTALNARRSQGFSQVNVYQARLDADIKAYDAATTPGDFAQVDASAQQQTIALNALWPAYLKLKDLRATLDTLHAAGVNSSLGEAEYQQDQRTLAAAVTAQRYQELTNVIDGQITQMMADQTEALPYIGSAMLDAFQERIGLLKQYGQSTGNFQSEHDQDAADLGSAHSLADYLTLAQTVNAQTSAMEFPLVRGKAQYDLQALQSLINTAQAANPLNAYEYASPEEGIGIVQLELQRAVSENDFQNTDNDISVMTTNLRALLDNLTDTTPAWQPHAADLQLMQHYGIMSGQVTIVSLREQAARFYDNGKLVYWSYVTTGRPEKPSPPGLHYAMDKEYHTEFTSGDPPGSPLYYAPTPINYAVLYANYGFFLHDAWWRYKFGPGSNLPHWDPLAFDGGSHGCINFPEDNMAWVYNWINVGSPIVVY